MRSRHRLGEDDKQNKKKAIKIGKIIENNPLKTEKKNFKSFAV